MQASGHDPVIWEDRGGPRRPPSLALFYKPMQVAYAAQGQFQSSLSTCELGKPSVIIHSFRTHMANPGQQKALWTLEE